MSMSLCVATVKHTCRSIVHITHSELTGDGLPKWRNCKTCALSWNFESDFLSNRRIYRATFNCCSHYNCSDFWRLTQYCGAQIKEIWTIGEVKGNRTRSYPVVFPQSPFRGRRDNLHTWLYFSHPVTSPGTYQQPLCCSVVLLYTTTPWLPLSTTWIG